MVKISLISGTVGAVVVILVTLITGACGYTNPASYISLVAGLAASGITYTTLYRKLEQG